MEFTKDNQMLVTDDQGAEHMMEILFTFENDARHANYVLYYDADKPEDVFAARYEGEELFEITDEEEYDEVEQVLNAYLDNPELKEEGQDDEENDEK